MNTQTQAAGLLLIPSRLHNAPESQLKRVSEANQILLEARIMAFNERKGPRVGDYVNNKVEGKCDRITHIWNPQVQTGGPQGSYHLSKSGYLSYSGSLDHGIDDINKLKDTGTTKKGYVWFFSQDMWEASNGVDVAIDMRVFDYEG